MTILFGIFSDKTRSGFPSGVGAVHIILILSDCRQTQDKYSILVKSRFSIISVNQLFIIYYIVNLSENQAFLK